MPKRSPTYSYIRANHGAFGSEDIAETFESVGLAPKNIMPAVLMYLSFSGTIVKRHKTLKDLNNGGQRYWCAVISREPSDHSHMMAAVRQQEIELNNGLAESISALHKEFNREEAEVSA